MNEAVKLSRSFVFYVATLLFLAVGGITTLGLDWYATLQLPSWTPSDLLVAFLWFALFFITAISVSVFWEKSVRNETSFGSILSLYMVNAMLVLLWNYLFFGVHHLQIAFWVAVAVGVSVLILILRLWRELRTAALLLLPYLLWMVFALTFTYSVMLMNP